MQLAAGFPIRPDSFKITHKLWAHMFFDFLGTCSIMSFQYCTHIINAILRELRTETVFSMQMEMGLRMKNSMKGRELGNNRTRE